VNSSATNSRNKVHRNKEGDAGAEAHQGTSQPTNVTHDKQIMKRSTYALHSNRIVIVIVASAEYKREL